LRKYISNRYPGKLSVSSEFNNFAEFIYRKQLSTGLQCTSNESLYLYVWTMFLLISTLSYSDVMGLVLINPLAEDIFQQDKGIWMQNW